MLCEILPQPTYYAGFMPHTNHKPCVLMDNLRKY